MTTPETLTAQLPASSFPAFETFRELLRAGEAIPYLGPGLLGLCDHSGVPATPLALATALHRKVAVSSRIRGNLWSTAQYIESNRHRRTLTHILKDAFAQTVRPSTFHRHLAALGLPLIVDVWYDAAMRSALQESGRTDWAEVQGATRAGEFREIWCKCYDANGVEISLAEAAKAKTVLYKPHGSVQPAGNFLVSDSDYVEVLTEIDIQTPVPDLVKERRRGKAVIYLGARFDDQMLRIFARQLVKGAGPQRVAVIDGANVTPNEARFLATENILRVDCPIGEAVQML